MTPVPCPRQVSSGFLKLCYLQFVDERGKLILTSSSSFAFPAKNRLYPPYSRSSSEGEDSPIHKQQQQQQHYTRPYVAPNMNLINGGGAGNHMNSNTIGGGGCMSNNNLSGNPKLSSYAKNRSQNNTLKGPNQISTLSSSHKPSNLSTNLITPTSSENNSELTFTDNELVLARDNTLLHKGTWMDRLDSI